MTAYQNHYTLDATQALDIRSETAGGLELESSSCLTRSSMIDQLLGLYRLRELAIVETKVAIDNAYKQGVMNYFIDGMCMVFGPDYRFSLPSNVDAAKASLRVEFWNRLLNQSEIFEMMPAGKRESARKQFQGLDCPPFDESTVRPTMQDLLLQRKDFFAARVDGIFESLSGCHVTNQPNGFSSKMIIAGVFDKYGNLDQAKSAIISDLRGVVGRLTGRGEPSEYGTRKLLAKIQKESIGKKMTFDDGAFSLTIYRVGTVHFEVSPEVAVELNSILAHLYPLAIPSRFRTAPRKVRPGHFDLQKERLDLGVIDLLSSLEEKTGFHSLYIYGKAQPHVNKVVEILEGIGGQHRFSGDRTIIFVEFDYDPELVLNQIIYTGVVPERASYQFYPTKGSIGREAASRLDVREGMTCCEPSAGTGDLAQYLPRLTTLCIELAEVRVKVLEAKGFNVVKADFLKWVVENQNTQFDRVLMNPPFSKGRALAHLQAASSVLRSDGRLVAILPASMINTSPLTGFSHTWSDVFEDQFEGTCVRVAILTAVRSH
jgi:hypothetical protein